MKRFTALALLVIGPSIAVNAEPTQDPATGNFYEVVNGDNISWDTAKALAEGMSHEGVQGHLATITSEAEFLFVDQLRQQAFEDEEIPQVWIGGSQLPGQSTPGAGWMWENGEGPIPGTDSASPLPFAIWAGLEPNDVPVAEEGGTEELGTEQHLTLGRFPGDPGFNDEGSQALVGGFIVEFGPGRVDAATCTDPAGCNPSGVVTYVIDEGAVGESNTVTAGLVRPGEQDLAVCPGEFVYRDPRVDDDGITINDKRSLDVFGQLGGTTPNGDTLGANVLTLDRHTYGSPCFAVVLGSTDGFEINTGTVLGTQLAEDVPGIGNVFSCNRTQGDLQKRTQYTYMTTDPAGMAEGGAAAMTSACVNPTSGTTKRKSFDVLNTHESCGIDYAAPGGRLAVRACFYGLANGKFYLLDRVLAGSRHALLTPKFITLHSKLHQAWGWHKVGQYQKSRARLTELLALVEGATFNTGPDFDNYQGDLIMRTNNLLFRLAELIQAQTVP